MSEIAERPGPRRVQVRRVGVVQAANVVALIYLIIFAIIIVPIALIAMAGGNALGPGGPGPLVLLLAPIGYAVAGWIFTALGVLIYNLCAGWIGGVQLQLEDV